MKMSFAFYTSLLSIVVLAPERTPGQDPRPPIFSLESVSVAPGQSEISLSLSVTVVDSFLDGWAAVIAYDPAILTISSVESVLVGDRVWFHDQSEFVDPGRVDIGVVYTFDTNHTKMLSPGQSVVVAAVHFCVLEKASQGTHQLEIIPSAITKVGEPIRSIYSLMTEQGATVIGDLSPASGKITVTGQPVLPSACEAYKPPDPPPPPQISYHIDAPASVGAGSDFLATFGLKTDLSLSGISTAIGFDQSFLAAKDVQVNQVWSRKESYQLLSINENSIGIILVPELQSGQRVFLPGEQEIATLKFSTRPGVIGNTEVYFPESAEHVIKAPETLEGGDGFLHVKFLNVVAADPNGAILNPETDSTAIPVTQLLKAKLVIAAPSFIRGDANSDLRVDVSDPIVMLRYLFTGTEGVKCLEAADADDSGSVNVTDPIYLLDFLFRSGSSPPSPGPHGCGVDKTEDALGCATRPAC